MPMNLSVAVSGIETQSWNINVLANDLANVNTDGFKALLPVASNLPQAVAYRAATGAGVALSDVLSGGGATPAAVRQDMTQGEAIPTGQPLDLFINGSGFFAVQPAGGGTPLYTRDGHFTPNARGTLVDGQGRALLTVSGATIQMPLGATQIRVTADGQVSAVVGGTRQQLGQIGLMVPEQPGGMQGYGVGAWTTGPSAGALSTVAPGQGQAGLLLPGYLEGSNASLATLLPALVTAQTTYSLNAQALNVSLQMWKLDNQL